MLKHTAVELKLPQELDMLLMIERMDGVVYENELPLISRN